MAGRDLYRTVIRTVFAVLFIVGGFTHIVLGRLVPEAYAVFGRMRCSRPWPSSGTPR